MNMQAIPDDAKPFARAPAAPPTRRTVSPAAEPTLGWFSIALGFAQLLVPRAIGRMSGVRKHKTSRALVRAVGVREVVSGAGMLLWPRNASFAWLRVCGDAMDIVLLSRSLVRGGAKGTAQSRARLALSIAALSAVAVKDLKTARALSKSPAHHAQERKSMKTIKCISINKPSDEVRKLWTTVVETGVPSDRVIVRFTPARMGKATEVRIEMLDMPARGLLATALAKLTAAPTPGDLDRALKHFKQIAEIGEIMHSDASIHDGPHAARPSEDEVRS